MQPTLHGRPGMLVSLVKNLDVIPTRSPLIGRQIGLQVVIKIGGFLPVCRSI